MEDTVLEKLKLKNRNIKQAHEDDWFILYLCNKKTNRRGTYAKQVKNKIDSVFNNESSNMFYALFMYEAKK